MRTPERMCVCVSVKCVLISAYQVSCPSRERREMKEKNKGEGSMQKKLKETNEVEFV